MLSYHNQPGDWPILFNWIWSWGVCIKWQSGLAFTLYLTDNVSFGLEIAIYSSHLNRYIHFNFAVANMCFLLNKKKYSLMSMQQVLFYNIFLLYSIHLNDWYSITKNDVNGVHFFDIQHIIIKLMLGLWFWDRY